MRLLLLACALVVVDGFLVSSSPKGRTRIGATRKEVVEGLVPAATVVALGLYPFLEYREAIGRALVRKKTKPAVDAVKIMALAAAGAQSETEALLFKEDESLQDLAKRTGFSPLLEPTKLNDVETVKWLLNKGCDPNFAPTKDKATALHLAMDPSVSPEIARLLLLYGANPNIIDNDKQTPFQRLATAGDIVKANLLIDARADPNKADDGQTPLATAIQRNDMKLAILLLQSGADPKNVIKKRGLSAIELLQELGDTTLTSVLLDYL